MRSQYLENTHIDYSGKAVQPISSFYDKYKKCAEEASKSMAKIPAVKGSPEAQGSGFPVKQTVLAPCV
jgi:hypothetical protein